MALASLTACVEYDAADDSDVGTISIGLAGQGASGAIYRLRDATFTVAGPSSMVQWHTEDDPDRTSLSANVVVGNYTAALANGWRMEKLVTGQPPVNVTATLVSPNPAAFAITPMMRTEVPFRFAVDGGVIDMSQGYDITIDIDELTTSIVTMPSSLTLSEGTSATIAVRLSSAPPAPVAVAIASSDTSAVVATPATLTFTPANFALPQVVTVTAVQDMDNANEMVTLALTSAGIPAASVAIIVNDDDVQTIVATPTNLSILENNFGNFSVRLAAQPAANVTVQAISSDTSAVVVTPSTLTFTAANYATNQFVTANAIHDPDLLDELVQVMLVSPGAPSALVTVHVNDID